MEDELKISYPTLRGRFNEILAAMGFDGDKMHEEPSLSREERLEILQKLDNGTLKPEQAELLLRGEGEQSQETER